jgi:integrase
MASRAQQVDKAPCRRNGAGSKGLYKRVLALDTDGSEPDPTLPGLRYVARKTAQGTRQYGQLRYKHPTTGKWSTEGLGRVPNPAEVEAMMQRDLAIATPAQLERIEREPLQPEGYAFAKIRHAAQKIVGLLDAGADPKTVLGMKGATVEEAIEAHIAAPRPRPLAASTVSYYRKMPRLYLKDYLATPLLRLDQSAVVKLHEDLYNNHGRDVAVMVVRILKAAWGTARFKDARLQPFPQMPKGALSGGAPKKAAVKPSGLPQFFKELGAVTDQRRDVWLLGLMTGLRRTDLVSIRREDIDLANGVLHRPAPKGGETKAFDVPLSQEARALVERVLKSHNSEWLFPDSKTKSGHFENIDPRAEDGFAVKWTPHDLRRIHGSAAAAVLSNGYHVQALMNHAQPSGDVTASYIAFEADDLRASQQAVTDRLRKLGLHC